MSTEYVLGFAFMGDEVVLIEKQRPDWQRGFLNGVGGKVEAFDPYAQEAMTREFLEETGVKTTPQDWVYYARVCGPDFVIFVFYVDLTPDAPVQTTTDETVFIERVDHMEVLQTVSNVPFLVSLANSPDVREGLISLPVEIYYK